MNGSNNNLLDGVKAEYVYFSNYSQNTTNPDQLNGGIAIVGDNNEIKNSTIAYSSGTLINIDGSNNRIVNNYIHDGSYMASYDPLLKLSSGTNNIISSNKMENSGRYIIYWNNGIAEISYNDISNGMWLSRDGALIYAWGTDLGNSNIHHNLIHDAVHGSTANETRVGLYFDNYTENVVAHHNVIYNNDVGIQMNTPGNYKLIYNNTIVNNLTASIGYGGDSSSPYKTELYGTRVFNNIFTNAASLTDDVVRGFNTITGDGLNFANAANNNYRLNIDSTAVNMGAVIPGITDGYVDAAPDAGAYEYGGTDWTAGTSATAPSSYSPVVTPYMNLIYNSGFEKNLEGWTPWTTSPSTATATDSNIEGTYANSDFRKRGVRTRLKLGAGGGVEQLITGLASNTKYKFVAWVYTDTGGQSINVGVLNYGGAAIDVSQSTANQYVRKEVEFTTGATDTSARVRIWRAAGATGNAYADDTGLFVMTDYNPGVYKNQALGKTTITASGALSFPERLTDGSTAAFSNMDDTGPQWVKIDLGRSYELDKINLLHYYTATDVRTYHDVIVQLSNDSTFATKTTVFNNDANNSAAQGTGTDAEYAETATGKDITFAKTNARYIRLWSNGNSKYDTQHYTEVQAWGVPAVTPTSPLQGRKNVALNVPESRITSSSAVGNKFRITNGLFDAFANQDGPVSGPASPQWIQLDLGQKYRLDQVKVWHFVTFDRIYYDVIIQLSNDPTFPASATTTVFNNDADNTAGQGAGTDALYADNAAGKTVNFPLTAARYVRLWANGNQNNPSQHYVEVEVYGSPDYGMGT
ncbi:discoidin domain-containing protein [Cohnella sp. GCM10020058]|uniref:galactose-binding domain-containing protein n=1 Tax=Cohnella sp. GCM10020058 TaxID=3317330 RepID=UPI003626CD0A